MIYARFGRFGPMLQLGEGGNPEKGDKSKDDKPQFAPMPRAPAWSPSRSNRPWKPSSCRA
jgi:topoisomerase IA-like protein